MKYERSRLEIELTEGGGQFVVTACVGEWHVHNCGDPGDGLTISHASGMAAKSRLTPVQAVRIMRALQHLPPCPVDDKEFVERARQRTTQRHPALRDWMHQAMHLIRDVTNPQGRIYVRG